MANIPYQTSNWNTHAKVSREIRFPVRGDLTALEVEFTYEGPRSTYLPAALGSVEPEYGAAGQNLYLSTQGPLQAIGGGAVRYSRTWASIPATQYEPDSVLLARPAPHDIKVTVSATDYWAVSFDDLKSSWLFTSGRKSVSSVGDITAGTDVAVAAEAFGELPTELCYISDGVNSTSFYLDTAKSSIQSALEASLTELTAINVGGSADTLTLSWTGPIVLLYAADTAAVTPGGGPGVDGSASFTAAKPSVTDTQTATAPSRVLTTGSAHGGSAGDRVVCWNGDRIVALTQAIAVGSSTITVPAGEGPLAVADVAITHVGFASAAAYRIANGPVDCSARLVRRFYLPGVTAGIANAADIPGFVSVTQDPVSWLTALIPQLTSASEDNWAIHSTDRVQRWLGGPILEKDVLEIQLQDAVKTLSVSA